MMKVRMAMQVCAADSPQDYIIESMIKMLGDYEHPDWGAYRQEWVAIKGVLVSAPITTAIYICARTEQEVLHRRVQEKCAELGGHGLTFGLCYDGKVKDDAWGYWHQNLGDIKFSHRDDEGTIECQYSDLPAYPLFLMIRNGGRDCVISLT